MKRRSFLQILGLGAVSTVLPIKAEPKIEEVIYKTGNIETPPELKKWATNPVLQVHPKNMDHLRFTDEEIRKIRLRSESLDGFKINRINS